MNNKQRVPIHWEMGDILWETSSKRREVRYDELDPGRKKKFLVVTGEKEFSIQH